MREASAQDLRSLFRDAVNAKQDRHGIPMRAQFPKPGKQRVNQAYRRGNKASQIVNRQKCRASAGRLEMLQCSIYIAAMSRTGRMFRAGLRTSTQS
jgi:hypothetical protein